MCHRQPGRHQEKHAWEKLCASPTTASNPLLGLVRETARQKQMQMAKYSNAFYQRLAFKP